MRYTDVVPCYSLSPPAQALMLHVVFGHAECGTSADRISIRDLGAGNCTSVMIIGGVTSTGNCSEPPYSGTCSSFAGSLAILIGADSTGAYEPPAISVWLTNLRLANLTVIKGSLSILVDYTPNPIPTVISPLFFPDLDQVGSLLIAECANCSANSTIPPTAGFWPALASLPGLVKLKQTCDPSAPSCIGENSIQVVNTGFTNLTSLSGLRCPPPAFHLTGNTKMASLQGLELLLPQPPNGTVFDTSGSGPFEDLNAIPPIKLMANCSGNVSTSTSPFFLSPTAPCTAPFTSYSQYCLFLNSTSCPVG
jgi:hypothetical protein